MRLSLEWLAEFVDLPPDAELIERLTMCGFEDVELVNTGPDLSGVRVGHVVARDPHPNADRLSVCSVDIGDGDSISVVCGAPNVAADQKIAFAPVGTTLPDGTKLKKAKIRGVVSTGMICSNRELGLGDDHDGILVLDPAAAIGVPLGDVVSTGSRELEVGITPNRGDVASVIGVAREVQALFGGELRLPETTPPEVGPPAERDVRVEIQAPDDCYRYVARLVRGVTVGPSPDWLVDKLSASGIRTINNIVDITNLVLLEFGQPLHAFDVAKLSSDLVCVRRATRDEKLPTLDGATRVLQPEDLVIADARGAIALAGVMGGAGSEVSDATTNVLIESAHFEPKRVRLGARRHGLRTEASYRFERGVDRAGIDRAADRAAQLMAELAGGEVARGAVVAQGAAVPFTETISFRPQRANKLLGTSLGSKEMRDLLDRVGVSSTESSAESGELICTVPSHRNDLHIHQDLTEEVARVFGYENIPTTEPVGILRATRPPRVWLLAEQARDSLVASGLNECQTLPFLSPDWIDALRLDPDDPRRSGPRITNPIHEDQPLLRTTLLPSVLRLVHQNRSRQTDRIEVFELSRLFGRPETGCESDLPSERLNLVAAIVERQEPQLWGAAQPVPLFFRAKGMAKKLLNQMGYVAWFPSERIPPYLHPGSAAGIEVDGTMIGALGELHPDVAASFELDVPCAVIELDLAALEGVRPQPHAFEEVSRQPHVARDIAVLVDASQPAGDVLEAIRQAGGKDLERVEIFDRYTGKGVPDGRVSLAFRMVFQRADRTLKDEEVTKSTDRVVRMLAHRFNAELR
jgi:phenylalanyl-tRNA synthetase beta chain